MKRSVDNRPKQIVFGLFVNQMLRFACSTIKLSDFACPKNPLVALMVAEYLKLYK